MTLFEKQNLFSADLAALIIYCQQKLGLQVSVREVQRTEYQQALYVRTGKSRTSASKHLDSLAADLYFCSAGKLVQTPAEAMDFWEGLRAGNTAGGRFKTFPDYPHFENRL